MLGRARRPTPRLEFCYQLTQRLLAWGWTGCGHSLLKRYVKPLREASRRHTLRGSAVLLCSKVFPGTRSDVIAQVFWALPVVRLPEEQASIRPQDWHLEAPRLEWWGGAAVDPYVEPPGSLGDQEEDARSQRHHQQRGEAIPDIADELVCEHTAVPDHDSFGGGGSASSNDEAAAAPPPAAAQAATTSSPSTSTLRRRAPLSLRCWAAFGSIFKFWGGALPAEERLPLARCEAYGRPTPCPRQGRRLLQHWAGGEYFKEGGEGGDVKAPRALQRHPKCNLASENVLAPLDQTFLVGIALISASLFFCGIGFYCGSTLTVLGDFHSIFIVGSPRYWLRQETLALPWFALGLTLGPPCLVTLVFAWAHWFDAVFTLFSTPRSRTSLRED